MNNIDQNLIYLIKKKKLKDDLNHAIENIKTRLIVLLINKLLQMKKLKNQLMKGTQDIISAKEQAKQSIKDLAQRKRDAINNNPDLTDQQKHTHLLKSIKRKKRLLNK